MSRKRKTARLNLILGALGILLAMLLDVLFGSAAVATTGALILLVAGVVLFLLGVTRYIRNPVTRSR